MKLSSLVVTKNALALMFIFQNPSVSASGNKSFDMLLALNIEELQNITVASKKEEAVMDAPSVVSIVTASDIARYGANNLIDILNRIPSVQYMGGMSFQNNTVSMRGKTTQHYSNRILFLINNRPFRASHSGGYNMTLFSAFPVSAIKKIEIIRGPGSVLYGSNAFSGVVNIITKKVSYESEGEVSLAFGADNYKNIEVRGGYQKDKFQISGAMHSSDADGWNFSITDQSNELVNFNKDDKNLGLLSEINYGGFSINSFISKSSHKGFSDVLPPIQREVDYTFTDVEYKHNIFYEGEVKFNLTHNYLDSVSDSNDVIAEASIRAPINDDVSGLAGISYEHQDGYVGGTDFNTQWVRAYAQMELGISRKFHFTGGLQYNKPKGIDENFSPRIAAVFNFDNNIGVKMLYAEAFRSAYGVETFINLPERIVGNKNLDPERIKTTEIQLLYRKNRFDTSLTAYHSKTLDLITRQRIDGVINFFNEGEVVFKGVELEGRADFKNGWSTQGSLLYQVNEDEVGNKNTTFTPNFMAKLGVSYMSESGYSLGIFNSYFADPAQVRDFSDSVLDVNPDADDYNLLSLNADFNINRICGLNAKLYQMNFSIYVKNLLDEEIYYPEFNRQRINSFPLHEPRSIYGKFKINF